MNTPVTIWSLDDAQKYHIHSHGLATWLCENLDKKQFVWDFGCGLGKYVKALRLAGFKAEGFEGTPGINRIAVTDIIERDITKPFTTSWLVNRGKKGTVICLEVMEHLLPEQEAHAIHNIMALCSDTLVLSWAIPNQPGHGHNNCRPGEYVAELVAHWGFHIDRGLTVDARQAASGNNTTHFFMHSLYVFKRTV